MKVRCFACGKPFESQRDTAKFCSNACRQRSYRSGGAAQVTPVTPVTTAASGLVEQTRRELDEADRLDSVLGAQALRLAEKLAEGRDTGSAMAALSKEFRAVMADALANTTKNTDSLDELAARRMQKASGA